MARNGRDAVHLENVVVDALAVMKILKHARENPHEPAQGPLLGASCPCPNALSLTHTHKLSLSHSLSLLHTSVLASLLLGTGLVEAGSLDITNCFPLPRVDSDDDNSAGGRTPHQHHTLTPSHTHTHAAPASMMFGYICYS